jgi:hypothetical protein
MLMSHGLIEFGKVKDRTANLRSPDRNPFFLPRKERTTINLSANEA